MPGKLTKGWCVNYLGADYRPEQVEWLRAIERLREELGRWPTYPEVLRLALSLGYRKVEPCQSK